MDVGSSDPKFIRTGMEGMYSWITAEERMYTKTKSEKGWNKVTKEERSKSKWKKGGSVVVVRATKEVERTKK